MIDDKWHVWVLEDSPLEAQLTASALASSCELTFFAEGGALLERLELDEAPELLVLDYALPDITGLEVCLFVRRSHDRVTLPILMLTGTSDEQTLLDCFRSGANDFVSKPVRPAELAVRVENLSAIARSEISSRANQVESARILVEQAQGATAVAQAHIAQKDRYIGILGHDLRNPLGAIITAAKVLELNPATIARNTARIQRSAQRMAVMIRDILDFARGKLTHGIPITPGACSLTRICADVIDELTVANPGREVRLDIKGEVTGVWDADRVQQAISNLVGNAFEHSETVVSIRVVATTEDVTIEIHNGGTAIASEELPALFEPFRKRDASSAGLGLGLFIVKEIARAHGGIIRVESTVERGTTFIMTLPRFPSPITAAPG